MYILFNTFLARKTFYLETAVKSLQSLLFKRAAFVPHIYALHLTLSSVINILPQSVTTTSDGDIAPGNLLQLQESSWHISNEPQELLESPLQLQPQQLTSCKPRERDWSRVAKSRSNPKPNPIPINTPVAQSQPCCTGGKWICSSCCQCPVGWGKFKAKTRFFLVSMQRSVRPLVTDSIDHILGWSTLREMLRELM